MFFIYKMFYILNKNVKNLNKKCILLKNSQTFEFYYE